MAPSKRKRREQERKQPSRDGPTGAQMMFFVFCRVFDTINKALWPITTIVGFYFAYVGVSVLAGKKTDANILAQIGVSMGWDQIAAYTCGMGGILYGLYERRLRIRCLASERDRNQRYEDAADSNRASSGLLEGGVMPPET